MNIPEIRLGVAPYLGVHDLCVCAQVCKDWNHTFTPFLYGEINTRNADSLGVLRHCAHARTLRLLMSDPLVESLQAGPVTRVTEMSITGTWDLSRKVPSSWVSLLQRNPEIVKLIVQKMRIHIMKEVVSLCPNLEELIILDYKFRPDPQISNASNNGLSFWRICEGQKKLRLYFDNYATPPGNLTKPREANLPLMRHLTVGPSLSSVFDQMRLISACTNLESLDWDLSKSIPNDPYLSLNLIRDVFQSLRSLQELKFHAPLALDFPEANWTRNLLDFLPPMKGFTDPEYKQNGVGLVEGPLSRHFGTLVTLDIRGWREVTSESNHLILTSCPCLQIFRSKEYEIGQISLLNGVSLASDSHVKSGSGPLGWVCTRLSTIELEFAHETPENSRLMFDQLCSMRKLYMVILTGRKPELIPMFIYWHDEASTRSWKSGSCYGDDGLSPWMMTTGCYVFAPTLATWLGLFKLDK